MNAYNLEPIVEEYKQRIRGAHTKDEHLAALIGAFNALLSQYPTADVLRDMQALTEIFAQARAEVASEDSHD